MSKFLLSHRSLKFAVQTKLALLFSLVALGLAAKAEDVATNYALTVTFTNQVWTVQGGPSTIGGFPFIGNAIVLKTDGDGRLTGSGWFWIDYSNAPYSAFLVDVSGKISSTAFQPTPAVSLTMRGTGYTLQGDGSSTPNSIALRFSGKLGPDPANSGQPGIVGKLIGTVSGKTPFGTRGAAINLDTVIQDLVSSQLIVQAQVEQTSRHMSLFNAEFNGNSGGSPTFDLLGTGQINPNAHTYRFSTRGIGVEKGWALTVSGSMADRASTVVSGAHFNAPATAVVSGRVQGQVVSGTSTDIQADLVTGN